MKNFRNAFSLVEMLVAVLLLTMLIAVAVFAFKYQLMSIHKTKKLAINKVLVYNQLTSPIESIKYYIVDDYDMLGNPMKTLHPFFDGAKNEINFITENPLFSKDIAVARLMCKDDKLIYKEEKLYGNIDFLRPEVQENSREKVFYKGLKNCSFSYMYKNKSYEELANKVPSTIMVSFDKNDKKTFFYINIKSDYNQSTGIIDDAIYPVE